MGRYVDQNLRADETIVHNARLHWIIFVGGALAAFIGVLLMLSFGGIAYGIGVVLFLAGAGKLIDAWITLRTSEFAVTTMRVIIKIGLVRRRTIEMNLSRVESIEIQQSILGRMLGYGKVVVIGTGGTHEPFPNIENPVAFRQAVHAQLK